MLASSPYRVDQDARALRERFELAVVSDDDRATAEAARALFWFCAEHPEYVLCALVPLVSEASEAAEKPVLMSSRYSGRCKACSSPIDVGDPVFWTPGEKGVACKRCGE